MTISNELLTAALEGLELQKARVEREIANVRSMLGIKKTRSPAKERRFAGIPKSPHAKRRKMSAAARKRIGDATRKRWAALRKAKGQ